MHLKLLPDDFPTETTHPLLYLEKRRRQSAHDLRKRLLWAGGLVTGLVLLILMGYMYATRGLTQPAGFNPIQALWHILFFPLIILQILLTGGALFAGVQMIHQRNYQRVQDDIRLTEQGTKLILESYRLIILARLRDIIALLMIGRLVLAGGLLLELISNRGDYLSGMLSNSEPVLPLFAGMILVGAFICSALLLPLSGVILDITLGLLIGVYFGGYVRSLLVQFILIAVRFAVAVALLVWMTQLLTVSLQPDTPFAWLLTVSYSLFADNGLLFLNSFQAAQLWQIIPFSLLIGVVLMVAVLVQAFLSDVLLRVAVHYVENQSA